MSHEWTGFDGWGRCADSGNSDMHAHLVGGNWINKEDLAPSPTPANSFYPSLESSQMRVAAAVLPFILVSLFALLLPWYRARATYTGGLLSLGARLLHFLRHGHHSRLFAPCLQPDLFLPRLGSLPQLLAIVPLLALPMPRWGFTLAPHDLLPAGGVAAGPMMAAAAKDNHLHSAAADAAYARAREDEEARLLAEERDVLHHNAGVARMHDDDVWDVHLT